MEDTVKKTQRSYNSTIRKSGAPKKTNPARRKREFARCYGSKARVEFVKSLPCAACKVQGHSSNAHLLGNGGLSRKADYTTIGPLCASYPDAEHGGIWIGCHAMYDRYRGWFDTQYPDFNAEEVARETEELWRASLGSSQGGQT